MISIKSTPLCVVVCLFALYAVPAAAQPTELFISEYIEGSSNNKAIEIFNGTTAPVDLAAGGYSVQMFFNGNPVATLTINLNGVVAPGDVFWKVNRTSRISSGRGRGARASSTTPPAAESTR